MVLHCLSEKYETTSVYFTNHRGSRNKNNKNTATATLEKEEAPSTTTTTIAATLPFLCPWYITMNFTFPITRGFTR